MASKSSPDLVRPLVLYDGQCRFCRWGTELVVRADRHGAFAYLTYEDGSAAPFVRGIEEGDLACTFHLFLPDGTHLARGGAAVAVLKGLPFPFPWIAKLIEAMGLGWLAERSYGWVAANRGSLSRHVPDRPAPRIYP